MFDFLQFLPILLKGALVTLQITFFAMVFSLIIGLIAAFTRMSNNFVLSKVTGFYISVFRGTPLLVQFLYIYYVFPDLGIQLSALTAAIIGLSLYEGSYLAEIFRGGIESIKEGQLEAAYSIGMTYPTAMKRIILPQAIKSVLPSVTNINIMLLKNSSLAAFLAVDELMHTGDVLATSTFKNVEIFTMVGIMYWLLHYPLARLMKATEGKKVND